MLNKLFKPQPPLPEEAIEWLFNGFAWALQNFGSDVFFQQTILVEPSNKCFPGKGDSIEEMAGLILTHVKNYAGLAYLPVRIVNHHEFEQAPEALADMRQVMEGLEQGGGTALTLLYEPRQVGNPNAMVANYAHALAYHLGSLAQTPAPCDEGQWPHMTELLAVYMGFGIMFVNTARPRVNTGCGSCSDPSMERKGAMDEMEVLYALAIFCVLKEIPARDVLPHIKGYLKPLFKKALKDVAQRDEALARLTAIDSPARFRGEHATARLMSQ
jgi:hypothetical protein